MPDRFIVMHRAAHMPASCRGTYRRVAVVETDLPLGQEPARIDPRCKGVVRIVETWERLNVGSTPRSSFHRALAAATLKALRLNGDIDADREQRMVASYVAEGLGEI